MPWYISFADAAVIAAASSLVAPGAQSTAEAEPGTLEAFLPYLTEGSFFALMGFAVGYATLRSIVRVHEYIGLAALQAHQK